MSQQLLFLQWFRSFCLRAGAESFQGMIFRPQAVFRSTKMLVCDLQAPSRGTIRYSEGRLGEGLEGTRCAKISSLETSVSHQCVAATPTCASPNPVISPCSVTAQDGLG